MPLQPVQIQAVSSTDIDHLIKREGVTIVDTRPWDLYRAEHLPGALFIPVNTAAPLLLRSYIEQSADVVAIVEVADVPFFGYACAYAELTGSVYYMTSGQLDARTSVDGSVAGPDEMAITDLAGRPVSGRDTILDVRTDEETLETGMLEGAVHIPHTDLRKRHAELAGTRHIYAYCRTSNRSKYAAGFLSKLGFKVTVLEGGMTQWLLHHLAVEFPPSNRQALP